MAAELYEVAGSAADGVWLLRSVYCISTYAMATPSPMPVMQFRIREPAARQCQRSVLGDQILVDFGATVDTGNLPMPPLLNLTVTRLTPDLGRFNHHLSARRRRIKSVLTIFW